MYNCDMCINQSEIGIGDTKLSVDFYMGDFQLE